MEEVNKLFSDGESAMKKAMEHLDHELVKLRTGKASTNLLSDLMVDYYGAPTPLAQIANIQISDARTIVVQPWERNMVGPIERAIINSNMGITPMNDGEIVRLSIPPLTEERRKDLSKKARGVGEETKVAVRNIRHKVLDGIKKAVKDGLAEDLGKRKESEIQDMVNKYVAMVDKVLEIKEKEIMTV